MTDNAGKDKEQMVAKVSADHNVDIGYSLDQVERGF
jgi:hypothetical protein